MAVVGAKLSEGLNFADDLARAVVVVGLPYPNLASTELKERMKYVSSFQKRMNGKGNGRDPGSELYENLCMRAVNQSIGTSRVSMKYHRKLNSLEIFQVVQSATKTTGLR